MNLSQYKKETAFLSRMPGVEAIFLSGSQAQGRAHKDSDIDLFIITNPGQIWTARFFVYMSLFLSGKMRRTDHEAGKYCPNHFITTDSLEIKEQDAYSAHLFSHNIPLHESNNIFVQFKKINQDWIESFGESFQYSRDCHLGPVPRSKRQESTQNKARYRHKTGVIQKLIEKTLKQLQIKKIKQHPNYKLTGAKIILTDTELRFHARPRNVGWRR